MQMSPFTTWWFAYLVLVVILAVLVHRSLRHRDVDTRRRGLLVLAVATWAISTWFTFDRAFSGQFDFPISRNLPFHFCTVVTFLLTPAVWARRGWWLRPLRTLLFFPGAAAAFLALASPAVEYLDQPVWSMNSLFYVVHALNVVVPCLMVSLGLYRPTLKDVPLSVVWFFALAMAVLPVTVALRAWVDPASNYFFFFDPEGAGILVLLWDLIGIPVLYQLPLLVLILPVLLVQYGLYRGVVALTGRRTREPGGRSQSHDVVAEPVSTSLPL